MKNLHEFAKQLRDLAEMTVIKEHKDELQILGAHEIEALIKARVFLEGKDQSGNKIGTYSTEPIYVNPHRLPKTVAGGPLKKKLASSNKKSERESLKKELPHRERKTVYLEGGYAELKEKLNHRNGVYDLILTGASKDSLKMGKKAGNFVFGYSNRDRMVILEGHEKRLGKKIFVPTVLERKLVAAIVRKRLLQLIERSLKK